MDASLNVLTLNCWGVRVPFFSSKFITERMTAIGQLVAAGDYDVVVFQEVIDSRDYATLCSKILGHLPHTHYYHSGFIGSGVCIFSRYPILETLYHTYPINGQAHKLFHADWYAGKGCALAVLKVKDMTVNVYTTHMHARFNNYEEFDEYMTHRCAQAFSLSQFVRHTSQSCDAVLMAGDFNSRPSELAYKLIRSNASVNDAWLDKNSAADEAAGSTCETADNCFTAADSRKTVPDGQRIDYIFYRANDLTDMKLHSSRVMAEKVPGCDYDFSDHQPLEARLTIKKNITAQQTPAPDPAVQQFCLQEAVKVMEKGHMRARATRYTYSVMMLLALMMLLVSRERYFGDVGSLHPVLELIQGLMAAFAGISLWISQVVSRCEQNAFLSQKTDMEVLLKTRAPAKLSKVD